MNNGFVLLLQKKGKQVKIELSLELFREKKNIEIKRDFL